jgi:acylphosphatase
MKTRAHLYVSGRVQGVFFRETITQKAKSKGVTGWIRNLADGRVEAIFEGEEDVVKELVDYCRHGPSNATVENIEVIYEDYMGEFTFFQTR